MLFEFIKNLNRSSNLISASVLTARASGRRTDGTVCRGSDSVEGENQFTSYQDLPAGGAALNLMEPLIEMRAEDELRKPPPDPGLASI